MASKDVKYRKSVMEFLGISPLSSRHNSMTSQACWCPGYEENPTKKGICKNCFHKASEHVNGECLAFHDSIVKELDEFGDSDSDDDDYDDDDDDDLFLEKDQHRRDLIKAQKRVKRVQDRKYRQTMPAFGNEPVIATSGAVSSSSSHPLLPTTVTAPTATPATAVVVVSTSTDTKKTSSKPSQKPSGVQQQQQQQQQQQPPSDPKRALIVRELITTERTYLEVLMQIVTQFVVPCREEGVLTAEDGQALFSNTESLYQLHSEFLAYLEEAYAEHKSIGHLFVQFGPLLRLYKQYAAEHDKALTTLARLSRTSSFVEFCKGPIGSGTVSPENIYLFVTSLIITPIQRIPRYLLLLKDLTAHTDPATEEYDNLEKASTLLNEIATEVGDTATRTLEIQNTLIGTKVPSLFEAGRVFVFEGDLHKITSRFVVKCHIFLFNDIMLYAHKKVLSWWIHKGTLHLGNCWTRALDDTPRYKNLFQIVAPSKTWTFYCKSPEERDVWLKNLDKVITLLVESNPKYLSQRDKVNVKVRGGIFKASSSRNKAEFDPEYALQPAGYSSSSSSSDSSSSSGGATTITTTGDLTTTTISSTSSKSVAITVTTSASTQSSATVTSSSAAAIIASSDESPKKTVCKSSLKNEVKRPLLSAENDEEEEENEGKNGDYGGNRSVNGSREEPTESTSLFPFTSRASSIYSSCKAFVSDMFSCCTIL